MRAQKNTEDDESGLEAMEKPACFGNDCVSNSGGGGCPNRQATNDSKRGCLVFCFTQGFQQQQISCILCKE